MLCVQVVERHLMRRPAKNLVSLSGYCDNTPWEAPSCLPRTSTIVHQQYGVPERWEPTKRQVMLGNTRASLFGGCHLGGEVGHQDGEARHVAPLLRLQLVHLRYQLQPHKHTPGLRG